jgi:hypothetical protein
MLALRVKIQSSCRNTVFELASKDRIGLMGDLHISWAPCDNRRYFEMDSAGADLIHRWAHLADEGKLPHITHIDSHR